MHPSTKYPVSAWALVMATVLLCLPGLWPGSAHCGGGDIPSIWQGTITTWQTRLPGPDGSGEITDRWVLTLKAKETQRLEVKDQDGSLVGWFVKLEDAGSSWRSETAGIMSRTCRRGGVTTEQNTGQASGAGPVFTPGWGWVYYSAGDDDPLASVLPSGTYAISSNTTTTQGYTVDVVKRACPLSDGRVNVRNSTRPAYLHYKIGGGFMFEPFAAPGGMNMPFLPVAAVQAMAAQRLNVPSAFPRDDQARKIENSRMSGSVQGQFHNSFRNKLSWDIVRKLDLQPRLEKCEDNWRPVGQGATAGDEEVSIEASIPDHPDMEGKWRFTLTKISCERGYCLNAGEDTDLDLEFVSGQEGFEEPVTIRGGSSAGAGSGAGGGDAAGAGSANGQAGSSESAASAGGDSGGAATAKTWETGADYARQDQVLHDSAVYVCILGHTAGDSNEPGWGRDWEKYWQQGMTSSSSQVAAGSDEGGGSSTAASSGGSAATAPCGEEGGEQEIEGNRTCNEVTVRIKSKDYGAWAILKGEVNVDGVWYQAYGEDGKDYVTIPLDTDENHIADVWEETNKLTGQPPDFDADQEPKGVGVELGDGFSNYEEYRGVRVHQAWTELDPNHKDLFIRDETGLGVGHLSDLDLDLHFIDEDEHQNRVVNFNRGFGSITTQNGQCALVLKQEALDGLEGVVRPLVGSPNVVEEVVINAFPVGYEDIWREDYEFTGGTGDNNNLAATIAHELAHGLNVLHHGNEPREQMGIDEVPGGIAFPHGLWSGDMTCVMRYKPPAYYTDLNGFYPYPVAEEQGGLVMTGFCESPAGTGVNAAGHQPRPVAGDAQSGRGACRKKITLKGTHVRGN